MAPPPHLDDFTLLVCGNALLLAMALTLATVSTRRGGSARALHIWIASLLVFVLPGTIFLAARWLASPDWLAPATAGLMGLLICFTVMQQLAVLQASRGKATWGMVVRYGSLALVLGTAVAWVLPGPAAQGGLIGLCRFLIPLFAVRRLWPLWRTSRGARVLMAGTALGALGHGALLTRLAAADPQMPVYVMGTDIVSVFIATLGMLLWYQERIERKLAQTAMTDALTGALNRHGLMPRLEQELARAERTGRPLSLVLCDLDHFKRVNDQLGHATGDAVLKHFSTLAGRMTRRHDVFGRWGGEEFLLILPEATLEQAVQAAERLRRAQAQAGDGLPVVTLSAGVVSVPRAGWGYCSAAELLASADHLLHVAKETRDRVVSLASLEAETARQSRPTEAPTEAFAQTMPPASLY